MAGTSEEHDHEVLKNLQIAALLSTLGGQRIVYGIGILKAMQRNLCQIHVVLFINSSQTVVFPMLIDRILSFVSNC